MSPLEHLTRLKETFDTPLYGDNMYERMITRLYLTSSTRYIPKYTLEAARLKQRFIVNDDDETNGAQEE